MKQEYDDMIDVGVIDEVGAKFDTGKPPIGLVRAEFIEGMAEVLQFGAEKYAAWNWANGIDFDRLYDAHQRHMLAWSKGETFDPETGKNHLYHAACELMFLACFQEWGRTDLDNRYIPKQKLLEDGAT